MNSANDPTNTLNPTTGFHEVTLVRDALYELEHVLPLFS